MTDLLDEVCDWVRGGAYVSDAARLTEVFYDRGLGEMPGNKALGAMMSRHRFESLGKIRVGDTFHTYYTRDVERFQSLDLNDNMEIDKSKVRRFVQEALKKREDDDDDEL